MRALIATAAVALITAAPVLAQDRPSEDDMFAVVVA